MATHLGARRRGRRVGSAFLAIALVAGLASCSDDGSDDAGRKGEDAGQVVGSGDRYEATIVRTTDGVPHITGKTLADAAFGQGYASGQDRPCDLVDQVLKIRGERSRWFGAGKDDANLDSDIGWRAIGIFDRAAKDWKKFPADSAALITAFADGWNAHLKEAGVDGLAGWCKGADWMRPVEPMEIYAYARSAALLASGAQVARFIPSAQPPGTADETTEPTGNGTADETPSTTAAATPTTGDASAPTGGNGQGLEALAAIHDSPIASNAWAVGKERSADGSGLLVGNPHFPWEGELRFWESHLIVPGQVDIYGVQLSGLPGIGIGFTKDFGWSHTVSAGNRFTAYKLSLVPGSPTEYRYGNETRKLTPTTHTIEVKGSDGKISKVKRTTWRSHYGPVIDFPGFGWTDQATITYRDANIDNDEFLDQYLQVLKAKTLDDLVEINEKVNGVPLFNTIAASSDGRAWYADTSATPNLSSEAITAYEASLQTDPIAKIAADNGAVLLDGSDPKFEWVDAPGARDPGLVPYSKQPKLMRDDYVFNANDSFWLANADHLLDGDYSPLHGRQRTERSPRTRENATVLRDTSPEGPAGADGKFTLDEIADASLLNEGYMARVLRAAVVERCEAASGPVKVAELAADGDAAGLPAAEVDIAKACDVLSKWDGIYDLDSVGAALWREFMQQHKNSGEEQAGVSWAEPFDAARPVDTPSGLAPAPAGEDDPVLMYLARAVQALDAAGYEPDVALGDIQFALRDGQRIPIHGGSGIDGTTNVVGFGLNTTSQDPALLDMKRDLLVAGSSLSRIDGETGYPINNGTSFLFAVDFAKGGPKAKAFLTYGNVADRKSDLYAAVTERFSRKAWRDVAFTEAAIEKAEVGEPLTVRG
ncbi:MAG: penicillin acylase family protein [Acidimicrobiales bacterium]|nr:penicillin acylase family protein [Acidimicrobiales bacterium]